MATSSKPCRVLVFDPASSPMDERGGTGSPRSSVVQVISCADPSHACELLSSMPFDALVLSMDLDEDTTATVVGALEHHCPGARLIASTGRLSDDTIDTACYLGAGSIVVRPFGVQELSDSLRLPASDSGFNGSCSDVPTALLLSLLCSSGADGILHLRTVAGKHSEEKMGSIYVQGGQPVHATAGRLMGAEAVHSMLRWPDAESHWLPGTTKCVRSIVGQWQGLLANCLHSQRREDVIAGTRSMALAFPEVTEKLSRLAQTQDVMAAFLMRHAQVLVGRCAPGVTESFARQSLARLANVFFDVEGQIGTGSGGEIQAVVGSLRLVVDRIGPRHAGYQVGVLVRQAAPVCKSLRRFLRQIDIAFIRAWEKRPGDFDEDCTHPTQAVADAKVA